MILYHFCCERDMKGIRSQGITKGVIAGEMRVNHPGKPSTWQYYFIPGWQWLTLDADHDGQSWATRHLIRYDRTEYRFTVDVPEKETAQLFDMDKLNAAIPGTDALFLGWPGSENWRVYHGNIPKYWLTGLDHWNKEKRCWESVKLNWGRRRET